MKIHSTDGASGSKSYLTQLLKVVMNIQSVWQSVFQCMVCLNLIYKPRQKVEHGRHCILLFD